MKDQVTELFALITARQKKQVAIGKTLKGSKVAMELTIAISDNMIDDVETFKRYL